MRTVICILLSFTIGGPVLAKGCIHGAIVGAVAGHFVGKGHSVAGAAVGCAVGHHEAAKNAHENDSPDKPHN